MTGVDGIYYAGNHGLEIEGPSLHYVNEEAEKGREVLKNILSNLRERLGSIEGVIIEDKGLSLSVHYRLVDEGRVMAAEAAFRDVVSPLRDEGKVRVTSGKKVWEIRPPIDWHKGRAVDSVNRQVKRALGLDSFLTIYLGDDTTDEDAFREMERLGGWGVYVGGMNAESSAEYYLDTVAEVEDFLARVLAI
jgi:trehalose-phosphatase